MTQPTLWLCDRTGAPVPVIDCLACATARRRPQCHFTPGLLLALEGEQNAIVTGRVDNYAHAVLTDYKTVDNGGRRLAAIALPMAHHTVQLEVYAWLIARALGERVQEARLVYITMGGIRTVDAPMPDETRLVRIEEEVGQRVKTIINPQLPAANPSEAWECRYCAHKRACRDAKTR